jgi:ribose 5-phosphate isomerase B
MKIAFGCDPNAAAMKEHIMKFCADMGHEVLDIGSADPIYANTAFAVASAILSGRAERGVLFCGTGIGMSIAANKVKGINAALISNAYSAAKASTSNDAQIACFGAFVMGEKLVEELLTIWLGKAFDEDSPSAPKVQAIRDYQKTY